MKIRHVLKKTAPSWWLVLCVNLSRIWCPVIWSKNSLDVVPKVYLRRDKHLQFQELKVKQGGTHPISLRPWEQRLRFPKEERIMPQNGIIETLHGFPTCLACCVDFKLMTAISTLMCTYSLLTHSTDFRLSSPHNCKPIPYNKCFSIKTKRNRGLRFYYCMKRKLQSLKIFTPLSLVN